MLFNSYVFIFVFLPVVLAGYAWARRHPDHRWVIAWLVFASLFLAGFLLYLVSIWTRWFKAMGARA